MSRDCVVLILDTEADLNRMLERLDEAGVSREHVSVVTRSVEREAAPTNEELLAGDESENKTFQGAAAGSLLGGLAGASVLMIPGVGPLVATGMLAGALTGGIVGGVLGSMQGWGVHVDHIDQYNAAVSQGKIVAVIQSHPLDLARAMRALQPDFKRMHLHASNSADAPELFAETGLQRVNPQTGKIAAQETIKAV